MHIYLGILNTRISWPPQLSILSKATADYTFKRVTIKSAFTANGYYPFIKGILENNVLCFL